MPAGGSRWVGGALVVTAFMRCFLPIVLLSRTINLALHAPAGPTLGSCNFRRRNSLMRHLTMFVVLTLGLAFPPWTWAWHNAGHMTIARLAYLELSEKQKVPIARILKAHPHFARFLATERPAEVAENEWAFLR